MEVRETVSQHETRLEVLEEHMAKEKAFRTEMRDGLKYLREFADKVLEYMRNDEEAP
jgi:hypothetical protein